MLAEEPKNAGMLAAQVSEMDDNPPKVTPANAKKSWNRWWLIGLLPLGAIAFSFLQVGQTASDAEPNSSGIVEVENALPVSVAKVESVNSFQAERVYTGEIVSGRSSDLGFEQGGTVTELFVDEGTRVTRGQLLGQLDTRSLQAQKEQLIAQKMQAQARLTELENGARSEDIVAAQGQISDLEHQIELAKLKTQRRAELYESGAISLEVFDQERFTEASLQSRLDVAKSNLERLVNGTRPEQIAAQKAQVQQLTAQIKQVDIQVSKSQLFAPFSGTVGDRLIDQGTVVGVGSPVFRLIEAGLPESHIGISPEVAQTLSEGSRRQVQVGSQIFDATIVSLLPELDETSRTVTAILQIQNASQDLRVGETAKLNITETQQMEGFWVSSTALIPSEKGLWSIFALDSSSENYAASRRDVEVLHTEGDRSLVRGLLQEGDRIITSGTHRIVNGQAVEIQ
ncbi:efflux transporter, RND family, MFP subunit [[Leptolyngbya] sp. PCC 7376]|uniref:efflux RND transporter periplasmic adaptor subunit n=1 Tax=[Leptolyngbya] sp. PCC 7376 TaxID=111781 RepID=UPI00029F134E|nr:efflux RND transporter periplasmic adaptor subunit [[Leptolyngbya] sp. PCC 7376]AFY40354.1 efflux transporter, RND family, MFP subunit [[Leptolyngbya] sp. PCC 7376]